MPAHRVTPKQSNKDNNSYSKVRDVKYEAEKLPYTIRIQTLDPCILDVCSTTELWDQVFLHSVSLDIFTSKLQDRCLAIVD